MDIKYLFSSPKGDIPAEENKLDSPFKLSPWEDHPYFKLRDYFDAIKDLVLSAAWEKQLSEPASGCYASVQNPGEIQKIFIRAEKHGALYHLASVEILFKNSAIKTAVSTALSAEGKACIRREFEILKSLKRDYDLPYLPRPVMMGQVEKNVASQREVLLMLVSEWFEDFHEWHPSKDERGREKISIWDLKKGLRFASARDCHNIYREISKVLTCYYNTRTFEQIYPWHNAAGDFIINSCNDEISVRLTTARDYKRMELFVPDENIDPVIALIYFFLNLSIKIRLDKLDGIGTPVLAGDFSVKASTAGFFDGLLIKEKEGVYHLGRLEELLSLLKSLEPIEIKRLYNPLMDIYAQEAPDDFKCIESGLEDHIGKLYNSIQQYH